MLSLNSLRDKLEDSENRANLRIRGITEVITDLQGTTTAFFQKLAPEIPLELLEFDRIHRSLAPKPTDGPHRDVIIKFHFYHTRETLASGEGTSGSLLSKPFSPAVYRSIPSHDCKKKELETISPNPANPRY